MPHTNVKSEWVNGDLLFKDKSGSTIAKFDGTNTLLNVTGSLLNKRVRTTTANVNAGATLLPAIAGYAYRLIDVVLIAVGGAAATATSVRVAGTQSTSAVQLVTMAIASLGQSVPARLDASAEVLADGASFATCDANTAITINANGTLATATHIDAILTYELVAS